MTPDFALILSHDTVRLLHRAADGWHAVGEADTAADDLDDRLAMLRRTATSLARGGLFCKVVLPDSLIRYLDEMPAGPAEDVMATARRLLDGATPYPVEDLVFDVVTTSDGRFHVAAVARETLEEAEAFAVAHRFNPVNFSGHCEDQTFPTEPDFGQTAVAADLLGPDTKAETDDVPVSLASGQTQAGAVVDPDPDEEDRTYDADNTREDDDNIFSDAPDDQKAESPPSEDLKLVAEVPVAGEDAKPAPLPAADLSERATPARPEAPAKPPAETAGSLRAPTGARVDLAAMHDRAANDNSGLLAGFLAAVVVVALGSCALWATGMIGQGGLSAWLDRPSEIPPDAQFASPPQPAQPAPSTDTAERPAPEETTLSATDTAIQEALSVPVSPGPQPETPRAPADLRAEYAVTGIWPFAPEVPRPPPLVDLEDLYATSIDPVQAAFDAVALPAVPDTPPDLALLAPSSPAPAGTSFALNDRGFVVPTPDGAVNPDGIRVFSGPPPLKPPADRPRAAEPGEDPVLRALLSGFRPKLRPADLIESTERATLSGLTRNELAQFRPKIRPPSIQEDAIAATASLVPRDSTNETLLAGQEPAAAEPDGNVIRVSLRPSFRPSDFGLTVARAQQQAATAAPAAAAPATVTAASVAPRAVAPKIPSSASVSREATQKNAINLRRVNLIGVYGKPSDRRALIRLGNGRYQKVQVGDRLDGGRVSAIGDSELRYQKSGRNIILKMPRG
ncbi:hypothetical protein [Roseobacter ponti]|uniref:Type IV pilus biogenesis n=1 Tax=Roseobacter ponti TaxID=1891787 RepID=A0A858SUZ7_9RHOB|nr:hypothetical protein [Roseobacter ponti]QJF50716.1 hypothetical protein G3256_05860 [Roseobacter ponti]